jgi:hypothetical protein
LPRDVPKDEWQALGFGKEIIQGLFSLPKHRGFGRENFIESKQRNTCWS